MLTSEQIDIFKQDGVLILHNFFDEEEVLRIRHEVLEYYNNPITAEDWRAATTSGLGECRSISTPTPVSHKKLSKLYRSLHAKISWKGENELVLRSAEDAPPWLGARAPHLDFPIAFPLRTLANNAIYWTDVETRGGAFMYYPGSHHIAWNYFRRNPEDYLSQGIYSQDQVFARILEEIKTEPVEFLGNAGDMLIWHSFMMHSASRNMNSQTRIATFGRWGSPPLNEPLYNFNKDMWSYWCFEQAT